MNFKTSRIYLASGLMSLAVISLASCSKDDPTDNNPTDKYSEFVGEWEGDMGDFMFFNDGNAKQISNNNNVTFGKWTFDKDTRILATTVNEWQFHVTLSSNDSWAASNLAGTQTYSFEREDEDEDYFYDLLLGATCTDETGEVSKVGGFETAHSTSSSYSDSVEGLSFPGLNGYLILTEKEDSEKTHEFNYRLCSREYRYGSGSYDQSYYYFQTSHHGTAKFTDIYSSTKCKLEIVSDNENKEDRVQHTFIIDNTKQTNSNN